MTTCTTCPYCGVGCGVIASQDGTIKGDAQHPANFGRLCSKGSALGETIDLEGRLLAPMVGGIETGWDEATALVARKFSEAIRDHGPEAVAIYASGQLLTEDYYVANKLMKGFIGAANIDTNSRLCMASSVAGHKRAFGSDTVPGTYEDLEHADLIVLVGSNLAWCHPVLHQRIAAAKEARPEMRIVNVDPRRTATSQLADLHLSVAPDGDVALFNGLLAHLAASGRVDRAYVAAHVNGFDSALAAAYATDAVDSGLSADDLAIFYSMWAGTEKVVTVYSQGVNQSTCGTDKVNAILNCHLATGRIGRPGMGPFSVTGQPNAMGGREVGGLANMLANHLDIENAAHRDAAQAFWASPTMCEAPGLKAVDLFKACADGRIKALWVMSTNPAVSLPDAQGVADAIKNVPFTVVSDIMARTDTGDLADVLLPAAGWGEKSGTVTNSERRISRQRAFLPVPGQARPDWKIISDVAAAMGWGHAFAYDSPADVFREHAALSAAMRPFERDFDISGLAQLSDAEYDALAPVQWPVPEAGKGRARFFADGGFYHPDGKARMLPVTAPAPVASGQFHLNTGRNRDQWHTMTRTGKAPRLGTHLAEPYVEIHPGDADALGLGTAELCVLSDGKNRAILRSLPTDRVARGALFAPMHWTRQRATRGTINTVVQTGTDPISGQPALKFGRVRASRFEARWYGFLACEDAVAPTCEYCAVARTETGWQAELAGVSAAVDAEALLSQLVGALNGSVSLVSDAATGTQRIAHRVDGRLRALLFLSPEPVQLSRAHAIAAIGQDAPASAALAGRAAGAQPDPGPTVCACMSVGLNDLRRAVADGAASVEALGDCTGAGTNCGACKPELQGLLMPAEPPAVAAE
ncbi:nitrate reductase [Tateyamaria omphalii]|uniref:Nitrate reductase n=1 Tax=Tateyamaria omphalii TaxID=299262 RepID=A0A1P8MWR7_9RHOB|nr:nitrate reductase [Tateyamaria omphalii]APX12369.1 nitrate reductase [Tateyamaria omphalii]